MNENQPWPARKAYGLPEIVPPAPVLVTSAQIHRTLTFGAIHADTKSEQIRVSVGQHSIVVEIDRVAELQSAICDVLAERSRVIAALSSEVVR